MTEENEETIRRSQRLFWETVETVIVAVILAFLIRTFVVESFVVQGYSMEATLHNGEHLLVNKFLYHLESPRDGQIIVFQPPLTDVSEDYIKRVIATPGQTVQVRNNHVYINGRPISEPYLSSEARANFGYYGPNLLRPTKVPPGELIVLGDNRPNSKDSRVFGLVPEKNIRGEAFLIFWPLGNFGSPY